MDEVDDMASNFANHFRLIIGLDYVLRWKYELNDECNGDYLTDVVREDAVECSPMVYFILPTRKFYHIHRVLFLENLEHFELLLSLLEFSHQVAQLFAIFFKFLCLLWVKANVLGGCSTSPSKPWHDAITRCVRGLSGLLPCSSLRFCFYPLLFFENRSHLNVYFELLAFLSRYSSEHWVKASLVEGLALLHDLLQLLVIIFWLGTYTLQVFLDGSKKKV